MAAEGKKSEELGNHKKAINRALRRILPPVQLKRRIRRNRIHPVELWHQSEQIWFPREQMNDALDGTQKSSLPPGATPARNPRWGTRGGRACFCFLGRRVRVPQILGWLRSFVTLATPSELPNTLRGQQHQLSMGGSCPVCGVHVGCWCWFYFAAAFLYYFSLACHPA